VPGSDRDERGETHAVIRTASGFKIRSRKIRIEIIDGPDQGRTVELLGPQVSVGSGRGCDLVLTDKTVSKRHMTLRVDGDGIRVIDSDSRNGTEVDGIRVRDAFARPDSRIALGNTTLALRLLSDVVELPLSNRERFGALLGHSAAMRQVFAVLERVAVTDATVLIEGESGTGKELVAEALHDESERASAPFVVFDCSAVSANLIESELFGHIKGAFTGAQSDRTGAFEAADGGTLVLDEIGELPIDLQPKLLRALERLEVRPVGSNDARRVDVRIVAATNRALAVEVDRGRFREDLYYRLAVIHVVLPPLRERADDIPMLVSHFCEQLGKPLARRGEPPAVVPERTIRGFASQSWPGNVRELRNAVSRAISLGSPVDFRSTNELAAIGGRGAALDIDLSVPLKLGRDQLLEQYERQYIEAALAHTGGNVTRAAELAGVNRKFIQRAMKRDGVRED